MKARLFRSGAPQRAPFEFGEQATIGRGEANSLRLKADAVSAEHARIYFDADRGRYYLEDLGSLNGTRLDGVAVTRPEPLDRLHVIEFGGGGAEYVFQALELSAQAAAEAPVATGTAVDQEMPVLPANLAADADDLAATTSPDRQMPEIPADLLAAVERDETQPVGVETAPPAVAASPAAGDVRYALQLHEPPGVQPIPLPPGRRVLGRARSAEISIDSRSVSRRHALLEIGERVSVRDLGSRNHTFVDGRRVEGEVEVPAGAELRFGGLVATLLALGEPE